MKRRLIYFTYSFPYAGIGDGWKKTEIARLVHAFDELVVVPFWKEGDNTGVIDHYPNVRLLPPVFTTHPPVKANMHKLARSPRIFTYLKELAVKKPYRKKAWRDYWLTSSLFIEHMQDHPELRRLLFTKPDAETYLYFFWGVDNSYIIPFLNKDYFRKIIVRFHGYDLYEDDPVYKGYLPYRKPIVTNITDALFVSAHGMQWFNKAYDAPRVRKHIAILGAQPCGQAIPSNDGVLRILTCSWLVPLKRVPMLAEALRSITTFPVEWTHVGAGEESGRIEAIIRTFPPNIRAIMPGAVPHDRIGEFYAAKSVDLFINISATEGMPVSIMEAMAAGVPVLATNAGGSPEIVGAENGKVLPLDIDPEIVAREISWFYHLPQSEKIAMRAASARIFEERLNAQTNAERLVKLILS